MLYFSIYLGKLEEYEHHSTDNIDYLKANVNPNWRSLRDVDSWVEKLGVVEEYLIHEAGLNRKIRSQRFDDFITYVIIGIIIGGRLGYVLFYNFSYFFSNPFEIFFIWNGGMSFHGGLLGIIIATIIFAKKKEFDKLVLLDVVSCVAPLGIFFGRFANFINGELYGKPTDLPWAVIFPIVDSQGRHPSQIYEALLEGVLLFIILNLIIRKSLYKKGECAAFFLIFYSIFRVLAEFFREPDLQIGFAAYGLTMGQLMSIVFFFFGFFLYLLKKDEN